MNKNATRLSLDLPDPPPGPLQMRRSVRRLGNFARTVELALAQFNERYGVELAIEPPKLVRAFLEWARQFDDQRELADRDRRDFSHFAAGLMLSSLIRNRPVTLKAGASPGSPKTKPEDALVEFWPDGVFYFEFCITVLEHVLAEQTLDGIEIDPEFLTLRNWHSFRENVSEDPNLAVPFLDLFLGGDPVWDFPTAARFRSALRRQLVPNPPAGTLR